MVCQGVAGQAQPVQRDEPGDVGERQPVAEQKLGIKLGESTPDGRVFLKREEECLAGCCGAPMMQVDHVYHTDLTSQKLDEILDGLE